MKVLILSVIPRTRKIASYVENRQQSIDATMKVTKKTDLGFSDSSVGKESTCNAGDPSSIPGSGRSSGKGIGYPLQYSCLENSMDRGAWKATVHGVTKSRTRLSDFHF